MPSEQEQLLKQFEKIQQENLELKQIVSDTSADLAAKNHELKIEAALDRVRNRAMAMQTSEELHIIIGSVFSELTNLDVLLTRCAILIYEENNNGLRQWMINSEAPSVPMSFFVLHKNIPYLNALMNGWKGKTLKWEYVLDGENKKITDDYLFKETELSCLPEIVIVGMRAPEKVHISASFNNFGCLTMASLEPLSDAHFDILLRFAKAFDLSYTRFNDLQKAETQAKEAIIEASLERVRSKTMAMHNSNDVANTVATMFDEWVKLDIKTFRCGIGIMEEDGQMEVWTARTGADGKVVMAVGRLNMYIHPLLEGAYNGWKNKQETFTYELTGDDTKNYFSAINNHFDYPVKYDINNLPAKIYHRDFYFSEGTLFVFSLEKLSEETSNILKRFSGVLGQTYRRFLDLQKAEAQAREAEIELALERVRASSMAMIKPSEFVDVIKVIGEQLIRLHIDIDWVNFGANGLDVSDGIDVWNFAVIPDGNHIASRLMIPYMNHPIFTDAVKILDKYLTTGEDFFELSYSKEDKDIWLGHLFSLENFKNITEEIKTIQYEKPGYTTSNIALKDTWLSIGKLDTHSFTDAQHAVLRKFANAFGQAHTRFLDLQKAETQARAAELEKQRSENLLLNILPRDIAAELKQFGKSYARKHDQVTILFSDIKGFSTISETLSPEELVNQLDECFRAFDKIVEKHGLEKIKTIGDAYVCACGLPNPDPENAVKTVRAAIDMLAFSKGFGMTKKIQDLPVFDFRFGIHTGPVVTGVVGLKKFTYDIWGDAVNMAARMEQHGEAGKINISGATYQLVKDKFKCVYRGKIEAKNKGMIDMYFVEE